QRYAGADFIVSCVDSGAFRHTLGKSGSHHGSEALWLDTGNGADSGQVVLGHFGIPPRGLRLPNVYDLYGDGLLEGDTGDLPSCSLAEALLRQRWSVNPIIAATALSILDSLFLRGGTAHHGALVRIDPISIVPLLVDPDVWADMGYITARKT
ncbi:UBA/THIF-type NAD/FAD binding fold protein, partial [mine drainage metagenome]